MSITETNINTIRAVIDDDRHLSTGALRGAPTHPSDARGEARNGVCGHHPDTAHAHKRSNANL